MSTEQSGTTNRDNNKDATTDTLRCKEIFEMLEESENFENFEIDAARIFQRNLLILRRKGHTTFNEQFLMRLKASQQIVSSKEWRGIVMYLNCSSFELYVCEISRSCNMKILHESKSPDATLESYKGDGLGLFDYIALEVTKFAQKHLESFKDDECIPLGFVCALEIRNQDFKKCILISNSKGQELDDLMTFELSDLLTERIGHYSSIFLKDSGKRIVLKTILNDIVSLAAGFYSDCAEVIESTMIVSAGINMAHIASMDHEFHHHLGMRACVNTESGKIGDTVAFYRILRQYLDPVDMKFLNSVGNEIRTAEKLSSEIFMRDHFIHNLELKFPHLESLVNANLLEKMNKMKFGEFLKFYRCNSPEDSNDSLLNQFSQRFFDETRKEFFRILRRSASIVAAIAYVSISENSHVSEESITIGINSKLVEDFAEYRNLVRKATLRIIFRVKPYSQITNIRFRFLKEYQAIGMARILKFLTDMDLGDNFMYFFPIPLKM